MTPSRFVRATRLPATAEAVYRWHARPGAFERLGPPWRRVAVTAGADGLSDGNRVEISIRVGPGRVRWVAELSDCVKGRRFSDVQIEGPFARWTHRHGFEPLEDGGCLLEDRIEYALPFGALGRLAAGAAVRRELERLFIYRHRTTREDLAAHAAVQGVSDMKILISGAGGLVGSALVPFLTSGGHDVVRLTRRDPRPGEAAVRWDPESSGLDTACIEGVDAVVHLAGENIAGGRWTPARKARIRDSRVNGTRLLAEALAGMNRPPKVLVCASAIGYYGDRGEERLTEQSGPGTGFLPDVCREWEAAAAPAAAKGIRVVHPRFGIILSPAGGALAKMLTPFRLGVGGRIGTGGQYMSWISIDDVVGVIHHALTDERLSGPVNTVSPGPVTNLEFTKTLGRVLSRPTVFPMPAFAARMAFGEMADELLLSSARVLPDRLGATGYRFRAPALEDALRHLLGRAAAGRR